MYLLVLNKMTTMSREKQNDKIYQILHQIGLLLGLRSTLVSKLIK